MMKLTYIRILKKKINGIVIHYEFAIPWNIYFNELKTLNDEKCDTSINAYDQLQLIMIDEVFLISKKC